MALPGYYAMGEVVASTIMGGTEVTNISRAGVVL
jgi:hypothetical protein